MLARAQIEKPVFCSKFRPSKLISRDVFRASSGQIRARNRIEYTIDPPGPPSNTTLGTPRELLWPTDGLLQLISWVQTFKTHIQRRDPRGTPRELLEKFWPCPGLLIVPGELSGSQQPLGSQQFSGSQQLSGTQLSDSQQLSDSRGLPGSRELSDSQELSGSRENSQALGNSQALRNPRALGTTFKLQVGYNWTPTKVGYNWTPTQFILKNWYTWTSTKFRLQVGHNWAPTEVGYN